MQPSTINLTVAAGGSPDFLSGRRIDDVLRMSSRERQLLSVYLDRLPARGLPSRDQFDPFVLRPWLGQVALVEVLADGGLLYRVFPTLISNAIGTELTGRRLDEALPDTLTSIVHKFYQACLEQRRPLRFVRRTFIDTTMPRKDYSTISLMLPLVGRGDAGDGPITHVLTLILFSEFSLPKGRNWLQLPLLDLVESFGSQRIGGGHPLVEWVCERS